MLHNGPYANSNKIKDYMKIFMMDIARMQNIVWHECDATLLILRVVNFNIPAISC